MFAVSANDVGLGEDQLSVVGDKRIILIFFPALVPLEVCDFWFELKGVGQGVKLFSSVLSISQSNKSLLPRFYVLLHFFLVFNEVGQNVNVLLSHDFVVAVDVVGVFPEGSASESFHCF